jgi:uncharacterized protein
MITQIYVNLPVKDLGRSVAFFTKLGFTFNPRFTDENATCMIVGENIFVMLLVERFFQTFSHKETCDAAKSSEVIVSLSFDSPEEVDEMFAKAVAAGATTPGEQKEYPSMHMRSFLDLDGHHWELGYMEPGAANP